MNGYGILDIAVLSLLAPDAGHGLCTMFGWISFRVSTRPRGRSIRQHVTGTDDGHYASGHAVDPSRRE